MARQKKGITDWGTKREALEPLFLAWGQKLIATAILHRNPQTEKVKDEDVKALRESFGSWQSSRPTGNTGRMFVRCLTDRLNEFRVENGLPASANLPAIIVDGTYEQFYEVIPEGKRPGLPKPKQTDHQEALDFASDDEDYHPFWASRNALIETAKDGLARGRIDQKLHYLVPDAVENWKAIIDSGEYHQYEECKAALDTMTADRNGHWAKFFREENANGVVTLGAGSPTKDIAIIRSVLNEVPSNDAVYYALIDFSGYMLKSSLRIVDSALRRANTRTRVKLTAVEWDFMDLTGARKLLRRGGKNVAWIIPGGTIGNLNEKQLFRSVSHQSRPGDIFVVGAEIIPGDRETLQDKYDTPAIRQFVEAPLRSAWHEFGLRGDIKSVAEQITIKVVDGREHSTIDGAVSVEVSIMIDGRKIVLLTSTRYDEKKLLEFATREQFAHLTTIVSPLSTSYKQFVFRVEEQTASRGKE